MWRGMGRIDKVLRINETEVVVTNVVIIQRLARRYLAIRRVKRLRFVRHQRKYQLQFETQEALFRFKFQQNGAAIKIQRWYRSFSNKNKVKWRKKFVKLIEKYKGIKKLRRIIRRSYGYDFSKQNLNTVAGTLFGATIVLQRIVRGFLGRRRFKRLKIVRRREVKYIAKIQSTIRSTLIRVKFPHVGSRYRMLQKKERDWTRRQSLHTAEYVTQKEIQQSLLERGVGDDEKPAPRRHSVLHKAPQQRPYELLPVHVDGEGDVVAEEEENEEFCLLRRESMLLVNMRLGPLEHLLVLDGYVLRIQCAWYRFRARRRVAAFKEAGRVKRVVQLQHWVRTILWRRRVKHASEVIQPVWKERVRMLRQRRHAATVIQASFRRYVNTKWLKRILRRRNRNGRKIKRFIVHRFRRSNIRNKVKKLRALVEIRDAGVFLYQQTETHWLCHFLWQGAKKTKTYTALHELQRIFTVYSLNGSLESVKFIKMMKECRDLTNSNANNELNLNALELQFAKQRAPNEKRIDYKQFLELICNLAIIKFLKADPSKINIAANSAASNANSTGDTANSAGVAQGASLMASFAYFGLRGKAALVTRFVHQYLSTMSEYRPMVEMLGKKAASHHSAQHIAHGVKVLQTFVLNRLATRQLNRYLAQYQIEKFKSRRNKAASKIQAAIRGFLGKRLLMRIAQTLYTKYIDGDTEREYWYNVRTNRSFWTKPTLLGIFDCGMATRMPRAEEQYSIYCTICVDAAANVHCMQCKEPQCLSCFASAHKGGQRKNHTNMTIDNCVQCEFQVGTRACLTCKDLFCDSCYKYMHRKGRLRFHVFTRSSYCCDVCEDLTAQWKETTPPTSSGISTGLSTKQQSVKLMAGESSHKYPKSIGESSYNTNTATQFRSKVYCNICYYNEHGAYPADVEPNEYLEKIEFFGKTVTNYRNQLEEDRRKKEIADKYAKRVAEIAEAKLNRCVQTIQRIVRGFLKRQAIQFYLLERQEFMRLRKEEEAKRNSLWYKFVGAFGFAPKLKSDTPLERVMKLYPGYMRRILSECVDNKWQEACRLLVQHEQHLAGVPKKATFLQTQLCRLSVKNRKRALAAAEKSLEEKTVIYEGLEQKHRTAQATGILAPSKMRLLERNLAKADNLMTNAQEKRSAKEESFNNAVAALTDCIGPRGLQTLIEDRRRNGVPLPFRVSLRKNSRLALVSWETTAGAAGQQEMGSNLKFNELTGEYEEATNDEIMYMLQPNRWKERLKIGDRVYIQGVLCKVMPPPVFVAKKKPRKVKMDGDASNGDNSDSQSASQSTKSKKVGSSAKSADTSGSESIDFSGIARADAVAHGMEVELKEEYTENHIQLDRPWLLDDCFNVEVCKLVPGVFYLRPAYFLGRVALRSLPVQKVTAIAAISQYKMSRLYERIALLYDEENEKYGYWKNQARLKLQRRDDFLKFSRSIVQMSFDFSARRYTAKVLYSIYKLLRMFVRLGATVVKTIKAGTKETQYEFWQRSLDKVEVKVLLDLERRDVQELGIFKMNLEAPCEVMREYIQRHFREVLNESLGDSFLFHRTDPETSKHQVLKKEDEFKTYSRDYALMQSDSKTMVSMMTVELRQDPDRGRVLIPVFEDAEDEAKEDEELDKLLK